MIPKILLLTAGAVLLLNISSSEAQSLLTPNLQEYALFTSVGAFTNNGTTTSINGNIGTNDGALLGFPGYGDPNGSVTGTINVENTASAIAATDAAAAYNTLGVLPCQTTLGSPLLGNGSTLAPGTYCVGEAATIQGTLTLSGSATDRFVFKIDGALTSAALSSVVLTGGAIWDNVYWYVTGQTELLSEASLRGNIVSGGAILLRADATLLGRGISVAGAIVLNNNRVIAVENPLPVVLTKFTVTKGEHNTAALNWSTGSETNSLSFEVERSATGKNWGTVAIVEAKGQSTQTIPYHYTDITPRNGANVYRLKMIDQDKSFTYSNLVSLEFITTVKTVIYPNPTVDRLTLDVDDMGTIARVQLNNMAGKSVFDQIRTPSANVSGSFSMKDMAAGIYIVRITKTNGETDSVKILKQ
jgi:hypothetical protein